MEESKNIKSWALVWVGLMSVVIGPLVGLFMSTLRLIFDPVSYNPKSAFSPGFLGFLLSVGLAIYTIISFIKSYKSGYRSFVMWLGFISALVAVMFWIFMIVGELLFPH